MRGGRRPGAGAPRGNANAFLTGRYSNRYKDAAMLVKIIPQLRPHVDQAPTGRERRRRFDQLLEAGRDAIQANPDLAARLELLILSHRDRVRRVHNGEGLLNTLIGPPRPDRLYWALVCAAWLIRRDKLLAAALTGYLHPLVRQALARRDGGDANSLNQTIKRAPVRIYPGPQPLIVCLLPLASCLLPLARGGAQRGWASSALRAAVVRGWSWRRRWRASST